MEMRRLLGRRLLIGVAMYVLVAPFVTAEDPALSKDEIKKFLLTAKVVNAKESKKGITNTMRLTLSDGKITHDASFQSIDVHKNKMEFASGTQLNFVDSYKYNIAAYTLAEMLGIEDMLPVYVERKYEGNTGSLSWWLPVKMDEADRVKHKISAPDPDAWNDQMYRIRVFDELIFDSDPNLTNVLIGEDWRVWRIDFTRAFRLSKDLKTPENLVRCDRQLLEKLKSLDGEQLTERTKRYLTRDEVKAVLARRDKIVTRFQQLVRENGEASVLY
jgi:hypothetical protein